ncbi:MAG: hypothetical protein ABEJ75_04220 [Candidatus Nanohaloarchaea archaeon]
MDRKGIDLSIKTLAVIVLGIMVLVLVFASFQGWFNDLMGNFVGNVQLPDPGN